MGACAEQSSSEWVCIPETMSNNEWFLWNTNSRGWTLFCIGAHDRLYDFFPVITSQKHWKLLSNPRKSRSETGNHSWVWKKWNVFGEHFSKKLLCYIKRSDCITLLTIIQPGWYKPVCQLEWVMPCRSVAYSVSFKRIFSSYIQIYLLCAIR